MLTKDDRLFLAALAYTLKYGDDRNMAEEFKSTLKNNAKLLEENMPYIMDIPEQDLPFLPK